MSSVSVPSTLSSFNQPLVESFNISHFLCLLYTLHVCVCVCSSSEMFKAHVTDNEQDHLIVFITYN